MADPPVRSPAEACGRPRVLILANIHAGEVEGKEACLALLRDGGWPRKDLVVLFAPIYNADGNDRMGPNNRPGQDGPALVGMRQTASGLDLNRDFMKAEAAETRALHRLLAAWDPHLVVDLHTTNGTAHGYALTYSPPLHPSTHPDLLALLERDWLPELRRRMRERRGFETFDYGNLEEGVWRTFDHRPRYSTNYVGLRNRLAILSEAYAYADFRTRVEVTKAFVLEILGLAVERGEEIRSLCARADRETARGPLAQALSARLAARGEPEALLLKSGDGIREVRVPCLVRFETEREKAAPAAYRLGPEQAEAIRILEGHGILVEPTQDGSHVVSTRQPLGRLVFQLLDPGGEDRLA